MTTETTQHRPVLIIVAGPNGSGKTTITSKILRHEWLENAVYINPDNVAQEKFGNWNSPEAVLKAAQFCDEWREHCLKERQNIIFESVFSSEQKINFVQKAKQQGFHSYFLCRYKPSIYQCFKNSK